MAEIDDNELAQLRAAAARVAELEGDAAIGKQHREAETKRITKLADSLPAHDRKLLEGVQDLKQRAALVERLVASQPKPPEPWGAGGSPGMQPGFAEAWNTPEWERVRARDPEGARRWVDAQSPAHAQNKNGSRFPF